jgi:hypothetical protein
MEQVIVIKEVEDNTEIKEILQEKFTEVAKELQNVMKIASKGERKGKLIFKPDAASSIYNIKDKFIQYVVRSIYDNYSDIRNGILWRMHCNEMFNHDFIKVIFRKLNPFIDQLETEYTNMRENHISNSELSGLNDLIHKKYEFFLSERRNQNVFNASNPFSVPFFEKYNAFKKQVKTMHPRVPDEKMDAYIEKDYTFRQEKAKIEKEHVQTFTEYNEAKNRIEEIYNIQRNNETVLSERMKEEYAKMDYKKIAGALQKMIDQFINVIVNSIMNGSIKF